jgi:TRAP-type uncharacterized transport system substrate-binding protein
VFQARLRVRFRRPALVLLAALGGALLIGACAPDPQRLRLLRGSVPVNQEIASLFVRASESVAGPIHLALEPDVLGNEDALDALENGTADLAIIENDATYYRPALRTVASLYLSVLHFAVRQGSQARTLEEALNGAVVYAGEEDGPARKLLDVMRSLAGADQLDVTYVNDRAADPDVIFYIAPLAPSRAAAMNGYELFDLARADDPHGGTLADAVNLVAPQLRPFVIPRGLYGDLTPRAITTVAVDTLLVARADEPRFAIFDLLELLRLTEPAVVAQRPDLQFGLRATSEDDRYTFPVHAGTLAYRVRSEPGFFERISGLVEALTAAFGALVTAIVVAARYLGSLRKSRIDRYYELVLKVRSAIGPESSGEDCRRYRSELRDLRDEAFTMLIGEKLRPDDSFRILLGLFDDVLDEIDAIGTAAATGNP